MAAPLVIAHRGASHDAPENTLAAFRLAWKQGADAIETDLRLASDGTIVAFHDADGRRILRDPRLIRNIPLAELQSLDAGQWKHSRWRGEHVPTLSEILAIVPDQKQLILELKEDLVTELTIALRGAARQHITLIAFDTSIIAKAKLALPDCRALWLFADYGMIPARQRGEFLTRRVQELGVDGLDLRHDPRLTPSLLVPLRAAGRTIFTYTVDHSAAVRRCARLGLDGITTNRPDDSRRWLGIST